MSSGRKRTTEKHYSAEDQALDQISKEAEERIQARRQARAEAREIRLREIERQQREEEDRQKSLQTGIDSKSISSYSSSRRGSNESTESDVSSKDSRDPKDQVRQYKHQLRELEDKYKAAMVTNAQLDNVKTSNVFQLELQKEQLEDQEEGVIEVQREYKDKCREYELLKRDFESLKLDCDGFKQQMELKDKLLKESGLVIITSDEGDISLTKCANLSDVPTPELATSIISEEAADLLKRAGEGTLGKLNSNEKVAASSHAVNEVKCVANADKADGVVETDTKTVESAVAVDGNLSMEISETVAVESVGAKFVDDKNNNTDTYDTEVDLCISSIEVDKCRSVNDVTLEDSCGTGVVVLERSESEKDGSVSESDDDAFYESRSEMEVRETYQGKGEKDEALGLTEEVEGIEVSREKEVSVGEEINQNRNRNNSGADFVTLSQQINEDKDNASVEASGMTIASGMKKSLVKSKHDSLSGSVERELVSDISCESDITYHSESEDAELFQKLEKESQDDSSNVLINMPSDKVNIGVNHETKLTEEVKADKISSESVVETLEAGSSPTVVEDKSAGIKDDNNLGDSVGKIIGAGSLCNVVAGAIAEDMKATGALDKENVIYRTDVEGFIPATDVCTSLTQNDEVFMTLPVAEMGLDQNMIAFVQDYVTNVVLKSADIYNKQLKAEKIIVRKQSYTSENIDISVSKRHFSEELIETASNIIPRKLSSGTVEIVSPLVHIPSDDKCDLKFFTCKVDTGVDVVFTSIEEEKNPLEGLVRMDSLPSPITGFAICYSGLEGHSDTDSESGDETGGAGSGDVGTESSFSVLGPEFMAMPVVAGDKVEGHGTENAYDICQSSPVLLESELKHKEVQDIEDETVSSQNIPNNAEKGLEQDEDISQNDSAVQQDVNIEQIADIFDDGETGVKVLEVITVSPDKSSEVVENISKILEKSVVGHIAVEVQDSDDEVSVGARNVNEMQVTDNDVEKGDSLGAEGKDDEYEGDENFVKASNGIIDEENNGKHVDGSGGVVDGTQVGSVDVTNDDTKGASGDVTEAGSRLSSELSPDKEGSQDIDSGSMGRKKSKKKGSKKGSKDECLIS